MGYFIMMILLNLALTGGVYLAEHQTAFGARKRRTRQLIIGLLFGLLACLSTELGTESQGAVTNIRDVMPLTAGLLFGGPSGILAGVIGGLHRWLTAARLGGLYTRLSCSLTTVLAGLGAAMIRKYFFNENSPSLYYVGMLTVGMEALHMLMVCVTHINDLSGAFLVVRVNTLPMILGCLAGVFLAVLLFQKMDARVRGIDPEKRLQFGPPAIPRGMMIGLTAGVTLVFAAVGCFAFFLMTRLSEGTIRESLAESLNDAAEYIREEEYGTLEEDGETIRDRMKYYHIHLYSSGRIFLLDENRYVFRTEEQEQSEKPLWFPLELGREGQLGRARYQEMDLYYMYVHLENYYLTAAIPASEGLFFRDITIYMLTFLIILLFTLLFFGSYVLIRRTIIKNIREVSEAMMELLDPEGKVVPCRQEEGGFVTLSEEVNHSLDALNYYYNRITRRMEAGQEHIRQFRYEAEHDPMTGLLNRTGFERQVAHLEGNTVPVAFFFVDVDHFKSVNDQYGHDVGDDILRKVAGELRRSVRGEDLAVRLGGDEFALLMVGCTEEEQGQVLEKINGINHRLKHPVDGLPPVSLSVGVAFSEKGFHETLLLNADSALYRSKDNGRSQCSFYREPESKP